jgi:hypothetical protein
MYDPVEHDCSLVKLNNENKHCNQKSDCPGQRIACDNSINGNRSYTCSRGLGELCQVFEDCANGLSCIRHRCECPVSFFIILSY